MSHGGIALGAHGEKLAARWYVEAGYDVVARNWRCGIGEIDLLVRRGNDWPSPMRSIKMVRPRCMVPLTKVFRMWRSG